MMTYHRIYLHVTTTIVIMAMNTAIEDKIAIQAGSPENQLNS